MKQTHIFLPDLHVSVLLILCCSMGSCSILVQWC